MREQSNLSYYRADIVSYSDYYPFGAPMTERTAVVTPTDVRYGFNGKEMDSEGMGGGLSTYDYGFRIYNPHVAKFLSTDPLSKEYPWYTPYQFAGNKPIVAIDLDGLEERIIINYESLGPVLSIQSQEWDLIEPGPLVSGVLIITYKQSGEVNMIFKKNIGAVHSETGPTVKQETSAFSLLQAIDDFLTPDGGFFYT